MPYWADSASFPTFSRLDRNEYTDVVVVGGGITGLTTAYLLSAAGKSVVLLERSRCAQVDTGHTTAHLTMVTDARLSELADKFGKPRAGAVWDAGLAAIAEIDTIVRANDVDCQFEWVDGYLHAPRGEAADTDGLKRDAELAHELGFDATFLDEVPWAGTPGIRFNEQARFHPRQYLAALARALDDRGVRICEHSDATDFSARPLSVKANGYTVVCDDIVLATHNPLVGIAGMTSATLFQTKLALYTSYVIGARIPHGSMPDALFWDTASPYQYVRLEPHRDFDIVIFGGKDHKTGQAEDTSACLASLEQDLAERVPEAEVTHRWSGQVIETADGLPYIGATAEHQFVGTGFAGNGMTFGTLSAMLLTDAILGRSNPWADLFAPDRKAVHGVVDYLRENIDYPYYMLRDRVAGANNRSLRSVKRGSGQVIERDGRKVAAYRHPDGSITLRSATCTHMGCIVGWNSAERTWDCPCHGSRFTPEGAVIAGPAESPLDEVE
jgi:glycine/D-amino acid oxidase-like deaminating enzyme/nitrite reductase/ring-hydroxylating ferredoxin subunit